jgi:hypothetical protein
MLRCAHSAFHRISPHLRRLLVSSCLLALLCGCSSSPPCGVAPQGVTWQDNPASLRPEILWPRTLASFEEFQDAAKNGKTSQLKASAWGICYNANFLRNYDRAVGRWKRPRFDERLEELVDKSGNVAANGGTPSYGDIGAVSEAMHAFADVVPSYFSGAKYGAPSQGS